VVNNPRLRKFLIEARARLRPGDVGLPTTFGRRQVPGLRREEVAELAGVSARWYELFESGRTNRRFSVRFVQRVADALKLDALARDAFNRLALPEVAEAAEFFERNALDGAFRNLVKIRDFSRSLARADSFEKATLAAIEAVHGIVTPDCMTVASLQRDGAPTAIAVGPRARFADRAYARAALDSNEQVRARATILCENAPDPRSVSDDALHSVRIKTSDGREVAGLHGGDAADYRRVNGRIRARSALAVGLFEGDAFRGNLVCYWMLPRKHSAFEIAAVETVAAILELSAQPAGSN
jgi:transcriptional regulator with XRE-family HTH domain